MVRISSCTKFQQEILIRTTISAIHKFRDNILERSRKISETTPPGTKPKLVTKILATNFGFVPDSSHTLLSCVYVGKWYKVQIHDISSKWISTWQYGLMAYLVDVNQAIPLPHAPWVLYWTALGNSIKLEHSWFLLMSLHHYAGSRCLGTNYIIAVRCQTISNQHNDLSVSLVLQESYHVL